MAQDRWNEFDRYSEEPLWGEGRRRERNPSPSSRPQNAGPRDWEPGAYDRYPDDRSAADRSRRPAQDDDTRFRPFGDTGPISTRSGGYTGDGRPYGASGRYDELSPGYREFEVSQRRLHRGDYDPDRYTPNPREGRGQEARTWWDRTSDEVSSWFGDDEARRRREWDERRAGARPDHDRAEHRGRGPKGYKRSDPRIHDDLNDRLTDDPYLDASDIEVNVNDGEVTLSGLVARREDKRRAEDLAESILGVGHVQNNLRVRPEAASGTAGYVVP